MIGTAALGPVIRGFQQRTWLTSAICSTCSQSLGNS
jgi:hypothetical protein